MQRYVIGLCGFSDAAAGCNGLWRLLSRAFPVSFVGCDGTENTVICAAIVNGAENDHLQKLKEGRVPTYLAEGGGRWASSDQVLELRLSGATLLRDWLRNRTFMHRGCWPESPLALRNGEKVVCDCQAGTLWTSEVREGVLHYRVALPLAELGSDENLFDRLDSMRLLQIASLVTFLDEITGEGAWQPPEPKACFILDDPNLHWPTYGYVNFTEVAESAIRFNYHVAMATIPLDCYYANSRCVGLFHENRKSISLLMHGNNHTTKELAVPVTPARRRRTLNQALRRIRDFEKWTGLDVTRVMAPPHGGITEEAMRDLGQMGFDAVVTSLGTLRRYNSDRPWVHDIGAGPADVIAGLPVLNRIGLSAMSATQAALAMLLKMPMILSGHHIDLRYGTEILSKTAESINSYGDVRWSDLRRIVERNYTCKIEDDALRIRLYTRRAFVDVPDGVRNLRVECPDGDVEELQVVSLGSRGELRGAHSRKARVGDAFVIERARQILVSSLDQVPVNPDSKGLVFPGLWPLARRIICEARDRLTPWVSGVANGHACCRQSV